MKENLLELINDLKEEMKICEYLTDDELERVSPCFEVEHYPAGTFLFREGDTGDYMGFVISGKIEITKQTEFKGKEIVIALVGKGSFIGEISTFDTLPRSEFLRSIPRPALRCLKVSYESWRSGSARPQKG
jgi:CRP-like cAMP-binding protein